MTSAIALSLAVVVAALGAGCAAPDPTAPADAKPAREYRTGSNIPVHDPQPAMTEEERARTDAMMDRMRRPSPTGKPGG